MTTIYNGLPDSTGPHEAPAIIVPDGNEARTKESIAIMTRKLADYLAFLNKYGVIAGHESDTPNARAGFVNSVWTFVSSLMAKGDIDLTKAGDQIIGKGGSGKLQVGTRAANATAWELIAQDVALAALSSTGIAVDGKVSLNNVLTTLSGTGSQSIVKDTNGSLTIGTDSPGDEVVIKAGGVTKMTISPTSNLVFAVPNTAPVVAANGWTSSAEYYRDPSYRVHFKGKVSSPTPTDPGLKIATLEFKPATDGVIGVCRTSNPTNNYQALIGIATNGDLFIADAVAGYYYYLDMFNFLADG